MGCAEVLSIIDSADARGGRAVRITDICLAGTISAPAEKNYASVYIARASVAFPLFLLMK